MIKINFIWKYFVLNRVWHKRDEDKPTKYESK